MIWQDIYLDKVYSKKELIQAISMTFNIEKEEVVIVANIAELLDSNITKK